MEKVEPVIWYADITQDGIDEKIVVDLTYVINYPKTGEEQTVLVYSGSSGELLWTGHADTVHPGWNGIYIYNDGKKDYLLLWQPTVYQDNADFHFRIFSLDEDGKEIELLTKNIQFDIYHPKDSDTDAISEFADMVNGHLEKSYVLVDTDNGNPVYSAKDNKIMNLYDISWILEEIKKRKKIISKCIKLICLIEFGIRKENRKSEGKYKYETGWFWNFCKGYGNNGSIL